MQKSNSITSTFKYYIYPIIRKGFFPHNHGYEKINYENVE